LLHLVIVFVKDEGINLTIMTTTLHFIIDCEPLKIFKIYKGTCFGHVISLMYINMLQMITKFMLG
jgi:hypothetical protein